MIEIYYNQYHWLGPYILYIWYTSGNYRMEHNLEYWEIGQLLGGN